MKKTLEQRVAYLERMFIHKEIKKGKVSWTQRAKRPEWRRSEEGSPDGMFIEENVKIYYDHEGRLVADLGLGRATLYAEYLPIYKDVVAMLEKVSEEHGVETQALKPKL